MPASRDLHAPSYLPALLVSGRPADSLLAALVNRASPAKAALETARRTNEAVTVEPTIRVEQPAALVA